MEHRQVIAYQQDLFIERKQNAIIQSDHCKDVHRAKAGQEDQINKEGQQGRALTEDLMTIVCYLSLNYEKLNYYSIVVK